MLARREHSEFELSRKLRTKGYSDQDIQTVMLALIKEGLLSNTRFVESYVFHRRNKGYGPLRIQAELTTRGIPEDMIDHHLDIADNAWLVAVRKVWQKRFKGSLPRDFKTRAQQLRFLQYRGFTADHINTLFQDAEHD
ncbi:MAG: regulatory protein RecX [Gammaproteobacteria bacterium]|nr:regulatory protein RecX [Gammaproteobacteria bacterium]